MSVFKDFCIISFVILVVVPMVVNVGFGLFSLLGV